MTIDLFKAATQFQKLAQDPFATVKAAIEAGIDQTYFPIKTITMIGNTVKVDISLPTGKDQGTIVGLRSSLQKQVNDIVKKINPALEASVTLSMESEEKVASVRARFAKMHKLADCLPGDPLCGDIGDYKGAPLEPTKPAGKPVGKPTAKPDANKLDDGSQVSAAIEGVLSRIPGCKLLDINVAGGQIDAKVEVPEQHSFTASQLSKTLTDAVQSSSPGSKVVALLTFPTKTASVRKKAQDAKMSTQKTLADVLSALKLGMRSFVWQPESKHILVEVGAPQDKKFSAQQLNAFLTQKIGPVAPGFTVITTITTV